MKNVKPDGNIFEVKGTNGIIYYVQKIESINIPNITPIIFLSTKFWEFYLSTLNLETMNDHYTYTDNSISPKIKGLFDILYSKPVKILKNSNFWYKIVAK